MLIQVEATSVGVRGAEKKEMIEMNPEQISLVQIMGKDGREEDLRYRVHLSAGIVVSLNPTNYERLKKGLK